MATIERKEGKRGVSYLITVHCGYDLHYRKIRHYKTWRVPEGWSENVLSGKHRRLLLSLNRKSSRAFWSTISRPLLSMRPM